MSKVFNKRNYPRLFSKKNPYRNKSIIDAASVEEDLKNIRNGLQSAIVKFFLFYSEIISRTNSSDATTEISEAIEVIELVQGKADKVSHFIFSIQVSKNLRNRIK